MLIFGRRGSTPLMVFHGMVFLDQSGQRTSVKCAEATWNYKVRGHSALKITCIFINNQNITAFILYPPPSIPFSFPDELC